MTAGEKFGTQLDNRENKLRFKIAVGGDGVPRGKTRVKDATPRGVKSRSSKRTCLVRTCARIFHHLGHRAVGQGPSARQIEGAAFFRARLIADRCSRPTSPNRQKRTSATIPPTRRREEGRRSRRRTPTTKTPTTRSPSPRRPRLRAKTRRRKRRSPRDRTTTTASTPTSSRTCRATRWTRASSREVEGPGRTGRRFHLHRHRFGRGLRRGLGRLRPGARFAIFHCSFSHGTPSRRLVLGGPESCAGLVPRSARLGRRLLCGRYPPGGFSLGRSGSETRKYRDFR